MDFFGVMVLCLAAIFFGVVFKQYKTEYAAVLSVMLGAILLIYLLRQLTEPLADMVSALGRAGISARYFSTALKATVLGYITQFVAESCRDFGFGSIAVKAELAGRISIFLICLPLISELFGVITELL